MRNEKWIKGYNDLATLYPQIAQQWNYGLNENKKPEDYTADSAVKVSWKCEKGHEWLDAISSRTKGSGCPYCKKNIGSSEERDC